MSEQIVVEQIGKWGIQFSGTWYSFSPKSKLQTTHFQLNQTYTVDVYTNPSGKKYINSILSIGGAAPTPTPAPVPAAAPAPSVPSAANPQPKQEEKPTAPRSGGRDFDKEARGKTRCAVFQAALQSPAGAVFASTPAEYESWVIRMSDLGVKYTFDEK